CETSRPQTLRYSARQRLVSDSGQEACVDTASFRKRGNYTVGCTFPYGIAQWFDDALWPFAVRTKRPRLCPNQARCLRLRHYSGQARTHSRKLTAPPHENCALRPRLQRWNDRFHL